jgi:hypothetical protein
MKKKIFLLIISFLIVLNIENCEGQWVQMSNGMGTDKDILSLAVNGNNIFAGTQSNGVFLSTNNGVSWSQTALNNITVNSLAVKENNLLAGAFGGIYLSTNNGASWIFDSLNLDYGEVTSFVLSGNNIFAGTRGSVPNGIYGVYISANNGINWTHTNINERIISLGAIGNNIFAGKFRDGLDYGIYLSTNSGMNWAQISLETIANCFAISENKIYLGTGGILYGVYLSTNNGANWTQTALSNKSVISLAVNGNNVFAGTVDSGFYMSTNNGQYWTQKNQGFGFIPFVKSIIITNNFIFAGLNINSVWRRPLSELVGLQNIISEIPTSYILSQNYPNPFNPATNIKYKITKSVKSETSNVKLIIFDIIGKEVEKLINEKQSPGTYEVNFDGSNFSSGIYFYSLFVDGVRLDTKKMILFK